MKSDLNWFSFWACPACMNSIVFIWAYDDFAHRTAQRSKLGQDAEWAAFTPTILPFLVHQESVFLSPTAFSPLG